MKSVLNIVSGFPNRFEGLGYSYFVDQVRAASSVGVKSLVAGASAVSLRRLRLGSRTDPECWRDLEFEPVVMAYPLARCYKKLDPAIRFFLNQKAINECVRRYGRPDIVHAHGFYNLCAAIAAARRFSCPLIFTAHFSHLLRGGGWRDEFMRSFSKLDSDVTLVAVSHRLQSAIEAFSRRPVRLVPNCVDFDTFSRERNVHQSDSFRFCAVGNLYPVKNYSLLLHAFRRVAVQNPNVELQIVGDGPERPVLESLVKALDLSDRVELLGRMPRSSIPEILGMCDCLVCSSETETFGVVVIEALASGVPVVSTDCGGPSDIIECEELGVLVPNGCSDELAMGMERIMRNKFDARGMRENVERRFSYEAVGHRLKRLYEDVV